MSNQTQEREVDWVERLGENHHPTTDITCTRKVCDCDYKFPTIEMFQKGGIFFHINLPLSDDENIPEDILTYIYGNHYDEGGNLKLGHLGSIKNHLNYLAIRLPTIEMFQEGGRFNHVKLPFKDDDKVPEDILDYLYSNNCNENLRYVMRNAKTLLNHLLDD